MAGELPGVKDTVNVYGYPTGGTELSVTQGIVSRIEFTEYYYSALGLRIQVDAALNPGNSGGPAVSGGKLIGVVFSRIPSAQSIGYLIPVEEIRMFLDDVADGTYNGKPRLHDLLQTVENSALRAKVGLPDGKSGILVVAPHSDDEEYLLKQWDVITQIGDYPIDSEGKVAVRYDLRLSAQYLVQKLARDGKIGMTVFRKGQLLNLQMPVQSHYSFILPYLMNDEPRYFIYGPLVFSQATQDYLERLGSQWELTLTRRASPLMSRRYDQPLFGGEELVVVCAPMFPHRITKGYEDPNTSVVTEINGIRVKSLRHLVEILRDVRGPQVVFKFVKKANWSQDVLVLNRSDALAATEDVLRENGIRYQYSNDIRPVWENSRLP
jgi:S1-C subfamily serine protease